MEIYELEIYLKKTRNNKELMLKYGVSGEINKKDGILILEDVIDKFSKSLQKELDNLDDNSGNETKKFAIQEQIDIINSPIPIRLLFGESDFQK